MKRIKQTRTRRIRRARALGAVLLTTLLAACGISQFDGTRPDNPQTRNTQSMSQGLNQNPSSSEQNYQSVRRDLLITQPLAAMPGKTSNDTIASWGMPARQSTERIENPHTRGQQDQWIELEYPGVRMGYYHNAVTNQEILSYLKIDDRSHELRQELKVGDSFDSFRTALGSLQPIGNDEFTACDSWGRGDCLKLRVADEKVVQLEQIKMVD